MFIIGNLFSLILVDYNSLKETIEYVLSCKTGLGTYGASHIVIVENGNFVGTLEKLSKCFGEYEICSVADIEQSIYKFSNNFQEIYYCSSEANLGYAKGNNLGIHIAKSIWNDPYYIVSNNDLVFKEAIDLSIVDRIFRENTSIGVIGPSIVTPNGELQSPRRWQSAAQRLIFNYWLSAFGGIFGKETRKKIWDKYANDTIKEAPSGMFAWVSGCFMIIRAAAFHDAGMFDENTFLYAEEMILSKRMEAAGYRIYYCKELEVIHNHAQTTKKALAAFRMVEIDFYANLYFYKYYANTSGVILFCAEISFKLLKLCINIKNALRGKRGK